MMRTLIGCAVVLVFSAAVGTALRHCADHRDSPTEPRVDLPLDAENHAATPDSLRILFGSSLLRDININQLPTNQAGGASLPINRKSLEPLLRRADGSRLSVSEVLHLMILFGPEAELAVGESEPVRLLDILCTYSIGERYLEHPSLVSTHWGARFVSPGMHGGGESHRDHTLATLGSLGLPLGQPLIFPSGKLSLHDVLTDSILTFDMHHKELEWTVLAYLSFVGAFGPDFEWMNRFGERFDFTDVAYELMKRPLYDASCGGTHRLRAIVAVWAASRQYDELISDRCESDLRECVSSWVDTISQSQCPDGSWEADWYSLKLSMPERVRSAPTDMQSRLLLTGHIADLLLDLPKQIRPQRRVYLLAGKWLETRLAEVSLSEIEENYCPYTHAITAGSRCVQFAGTQPASTETGGI